MFGQETRGVSLVICERLIREEATGICSAVGIINSVVAFQYPVTVRLSVYAAVERGENSPKAEEIYLGIDRPDGSPACGKATRVHDWGGEPLCEMSHSNFVVVVPAPAIYRARLFLKDRDLLWQHIEFASAEGIQGAPGHPR